ncbi:hypothetical protein [Streptomyces platensis]|uniref:hypothetical protein n=1 Tax=Streptomyces platensis TaxID=58346 RepID=UPI003867CAC1|nr:hypothetical protein OG962_08095 [Streptomyces platensis]
MGSLLELETEPLVRTLANIDMWIQSRSGVTAVPAVAPPAVGTRPAADGRASAPCRPKSRFTDATSRFTEAPAIATAPRVTTAVLPSAGR